MKYKQRHKDIIEVTYKREIRLNTFFSMQLDLYHHLHSLIPAKIFYNVYKINESLHV